MNSTRTNLFFLLILLGGTSCGAHHHEVKALPALHHQTDERILFLAIDGIGFDVMKEMKEEGYFKDFGSPVPFIVPFPSGTTTGFTGIFQPLDVGKVPGYEIRFYSFEKNKVIGGTPWEFYKIPINYKTYFDSFRHSLVEKGIMYAFSGMAGKQDLARTERLLMESPKKILFSYMGGTDGHQHILGKKRIRRFLIFTDKFLSRMKKRYAKKHQIPLRIVIFSDHGFHFVPKMKTIWGRDIAHIIEKNGYQVSPHLDDPHDVVLVKFGLLNGGGHHDSEKSGRGGSKASDKC